MQDRQRIVAQTEADQVAEACLDRHGAAAGDAAVAHAFLVANPGFGAIEVGAENQQGFHGVGRGGGEGARIITSR